MHKEIQIAVEPHVQLYFQKNDHLLAIKGKSLLNSLLSLKKGELKIDDSKEHLEIIEPNKKYVSLKVSVAIYFWISCNSKADEIRKRLALALKRLMMAQFYNWVDACMCCGKNRYEATIQFLDYYKIYDLDPDYLYRMYTEHASKKWLQIKLNLGFV